MAGSRFDSVRVFHHDTHRPQYIVADDEGTCNQLLLSSYNIMKHVDILMNV